VSLDGGVSRLMEGGPIGEHVGFEILPRTVPDFVVRQKWATENRSLCNHGTRVRISNTLC
jgi:hypothetical protein